mgnify:CR=1 FL=1
MNKKKKLLIFFVIWIVIILILLFQKPIIRVLKKSEYLQLQYENVDNVEIIFSNRNGIVKLNNKTAIEKLVNYLNSLELINEENKNNGNEDFVVYLYGNMPSTVISFSEDYLYFSDAECWDCIYTEYYIVGSKFSDVKISGTYNFLNELINEYGEDELEDWLNLFYRANKFYSLSAPFFIQNSRVSNKNGW